MKARRARARAIQGGLSPRDRRGDNNHRARTMALILAKRCFVNRKSEHRETVAPGM